MFSDKIKPLVVAETFSLNQDAEKAVNNFKKEIREALWHSIDEIIPLVVETDASSMAIAVNVKQAGHVLFPHTHSYRMQACICCKRSLHYNRGSKKEVLLLVRMKIHNCHRLNGYQLCFI